ncbi:MAG: hypothetical protein PF495_05355 [Spirochaetales bacterium]|nr:hypothetical protein [Spirochaetales bacterium]
MKKPQFHEEIQANLERADQALAAAETLLAGGLILPLPGHIMPLSMPQQPFC